MHATQLHSHCPLAHSIFFYILLTKNAFENEWKARTVLPAPSCTSPPPTSAQKMHGQLANQNQQPQAQSDEVTPAAAVPPVALAPPPVNSAPQQQSLTLTTTTTLTATTTPSPAVDPPAPATPQSKQTSSTSALSNQQQQPSSPPRMSSPDMDVDVGGTPEPDDMARDGESDLVVQQLERGLPRWEGPAMGDFGWLKEMEGSEDRRLELVLAIKGHKDAVYVSLFPLPALILMSPQWQSLCNCARGHARGNHYPLLVIQRMSWPLCYSVGTICLTLCVSVPSIAETGRGIEALPVLQRSLLISGVEPCAFQCLRIQQSI